MSETQALKENERFIRWWAKKFKASLSMEMEDLLQEGRLAFVKAFRKWKPELGSLATYAGNAINMAFLEMVRKEDRFCRRQPPTSSLSGAAGPWEQYPDFAGRGRLAEDEIGAPDPAFERVERRDLHAAVKAAHERASERTQRIFDQHFVEEKSVKDISEELGLSRQKVHRILQKEKERLQKAVA